MWSSLESPSSSRVARYYFNIYNREPHWDDQGYEFTDLAAARDAASRICAEVVRNLQSDCTGEEWRMEVTDDAGEPLLTLRFVAIEHERPEHEAPLPRAAEFPGSGDIRVRQEQ